MIKWFKARSFEFYLATALVLLILAYTLGVLESVLIKQEFKAKCIENNGVPVNNGREMVCWHKEQK